MADLDFCVPLIPPSVNDCPELYYYRTKKPKFRVLSNGCWEWIAAKHPLGYGMSKLSTGIYAHRVVYERCVGPIAAGLTLDHTCRNRSCVNPLHLEPVSLAENIRRSPRTKLNLAQVQEIKHSQLGHAELGRKFGVTREAIFRIRKGLSWRT